MVIVVMGVAGVGKTTVGRLLAEQLGWQFADADDYHSTGNIEKIRRGIPLNDDDRRPWLSQLRVIICDWIAQRRNAVLACSALKHRYQDELRAGPEVRFVLLYGDANLIAQRLRIRQDHFAGTAILANQLADLEEPQAAVRANIAQPPEKIVAEILERLDLA
jgi:gluconokinase